MATVVEATVGEPLPAPAPHKDHGSQTSRSAPERVLIVRLGSDKVGSQAGQSIELPFRESVFDDNVPPFAPTQLSERVAESVANAGTLASARRAGRLGGSPDSAR